MRIDVSSPRQIVIGIGLMAVIALLMAGYIAKGVLSERAEADALQNDGVVVTATVTALADLSRTGVPLTAEVRLPDGRVTKVDIAERRSSSIPEVGSRMEILVQRGDISNNRPTDAQPSGGEWRASGLAVLVGIALVCLVTCVVVAHTMSRRGRRDDRRPPH